MSRMSKSDDIEEYNLKLLEEKFGERPRHWRIKKLTVSGFMTGYQQSYSAYSKEEKEQLLKGRRVLMTKEKVRFNIEDDLEVEHNINAYVELLNYKTPLTEDIINKVKSKHKEAENAERQRKEAEQQQKQQEAERERKEAEQKQKQEEAERERKEAERQQKQELNSKATKRMDKTGAVTSILANLSSFGGKKSRKSRKSRKSSPKRKRRTYKK